MADRSEWSRRHFHSLRVLPHVIPNGLTVAEPSGKQNLSTERNSRI